MSLKLTSGPAAGNVYNFEQKTQLTIDWSLDGLYFKYKDENWIVLSLGPKTTINELDKINTSEMVSEFKTLCFHALNNIRDHSIIADKAMIEVEKIINGFI